MITFYLTHIPFLVTIFLAAFQLAQSLFQPRQLFTFLFLSRLFLIRFRFKRFRLNFPLISPIRFYISYKFPFRFSRLSSLCLASKASHVVAVVMASARLCGRERCTCLDISTEGRPRMNNPTNTQSSTGLPGYASRAKRRRAKPNTSTDSFFSHTLFHNSTAYRASLPVGLYLFKSSLRRCA